MSHQTKNKKIYNLAIEYFQHSSTEMNKKSNFGNSGNSNNQRLPKIVDVDEEDIISRKKSPFQNIFNVENNEKMKK